MSENSSVYFCKTELFEIEPFICIEMDLVLITYNGQCGIKPNQTKSKLFLKKYKV